MCEVITIAEYEQLYYDGALEGKNIHGRLINQDTFRSLEEFIWRLNYENNGEDENFKDVLRLSSFHGRPTLRAQNYVGVISAANQTIEILPKTAITHSDNSIQESREAFIYMLSYLKDEPFRRLRNSDLSSGRFPILETFISSFLNEVEDVIKRGLKSKYNIVAGNERFLKGRISFSEQIKKNSADQSRFFVEYSKFTLDSPENRIIKSALLAVEKKSREDTNRGRIKRCLDRFSDIDESEDPSLDYKRCIKDRDNVHYQTALMWAKLFINGESLQPFSGTFSTEAILFSMEKVFERYVAQRLKEACREDGTAVKVQDAGKYLVNSSKKHLMRPDIVVERDNVCAILDTKWKMVKEPNLSDMYQMLTYAMKYDVEHVILVYPYYADVGSDKNEEYDIDLNLKDLGEKRIKIHSFFFKLPSWVKKAPSPVFKDGIEDLRGFLNSRILLP